jgi:predicted dehydrogenase
MLFKRKSADVVKAAVVGTGYLGKFHAEKYAKSDNSELVCVVDIDQARADEIAGKVRSRGVTDYKKLPELGVRCASIASTTATHYEIASWLLRNGIDVLVEKPIATSVEQAKDLARIAAENNRILQVGHLERFNPAFRAIKMLLSKPRFFEVRRIASFAGRGHDVNVVLDLMIHDIDIVAHLIGRPLVRVDAVGIPVITDSVDIANARLTFEGGVVANLTASRAAFKTERTIRMFQPDLYVSLDYGKKAAKIYNKTGKKTLLGFPEIAVKEYPVEERDALADEIEAFLQSVKSRQRPEVSGEDGIIALSIAERVCRAIEENTAEHARDLKPLQVANLV